MSESQKILSIPEVQKIWDKMAGLYASDGLDSTPQSFYFAIVNMLQIPTAKNILEVGCGRCILVPYCLQLMNEEATYLATDLSSKMVQAAEDKIKSTLKKFDCSLSYEEWSKKHHFAIKAANAEQVIDGNTKFDRIICNMVLMLTENPRKMLQSLYDQAEEGCLLGVSIWGNHQLNIGNEELEKLIAELNVPAPKFRSNYHLYNKASILAEEVGWKLVVTWEQVSVFPFGSQSALQTYGRAMATKLAFLPQQKKLWAQQEYFARLVKRIKQNKEALTFPSQIYIFKK